MQTGNFRTPSELLVGYKSSSYKQQILAYSRKTLSPRVTTDEYQVLLRYIL